MTEKALVFPGPAQLMLAAITLSLVANAARSDATSIPEYITAHVVIESAMPLGFQVLHFGYITERPLDDGSPFCYIEKQLVSMCQEYDADYYREDHRNRQYSGIVISNRFFAHNDPTTLPERTTWYPNSINTSATLKCNAERLSSDLVRLSIHEHSGGQNHQRRIEHDLLIDVSRSVPWGVRTLISGGASSYSVVSYVGRKFSQNQGKISITDLKPLRAERPGELGVRIPLDCQYIGFPAVRTRESRGR